LVVGGFFLYNYSKHIERGDSKNSLLDLKKYSFNSNYITGEIYCREKFDSEEEALFYIEDEEVCPKANLTYYPARYYYYMFKEKIIPIIGFN